MGCLKWHLHVRFFYLIAGELLIEPVDGDFKKLPSPEQLRRKVILKVILYVQSNNIWLRRQDTYTMYFQIFEGK